MHQIAERKMGTGVDEGNGTVLRKPGSESKSGQRWRGGSSRKTRPHHLVCCAFTIPSVVGGRGNERVVSQVRVCGILYSRACTWSPRCRRLNSTKGTEIQHDVTDSAWGAATSKVGVERVEARQKGWATRGERGGILKG